MNSNRVKIDTQTILNPNVPEQKLLNVKQFIILNLCSFGFYQICWIFQAWRFFLQKDQIDIKIAARTGFSIVYLYPLFLKIYNYLYQLNKKFVLKIFLLYFAIVLTSILPEPLSYISIFGFLLLIPSFNQLNQAKKNDPHLVTIDVLHFSIGHKITITIGVLMWSLILFSIYWNLFHQS